MYQIQDNLNMQKISILKRQWRSWLRDNVCLKNCFKDIKDSNFSSLNIEFVEFWGPVF